MSGTRRSSCFINIDQAQLYCESLGKGVPLVMLHAGIADSRMWNGEFEFFADTNRAIRYDLRGYGRSEPAPGEFTHLDDLVAVMDAIGVDRPVVLMGCSMSAGLAVDMALAHPERVKALVLVSGGVTGLKSTAPKSPKAAEAERAWEQGDVDGTAEIETQMWFDGVGRAPEKVDQPARQLVLEMNRLALSYESRKLGTRGPNLTPPSAQRLNEIKIPVLIIVGAQDQPYVAEAAEYILKHIPTAQRAVVQNAAHLPNLDHPEIFRDLVKDFLTRAVA
jgi:2-hydroxy-6-oxonona-2,4-dienedioate hydrolase